MNYPLLPIPRESGDWISWAEALVVQLSQPGVAYATSYELQEAVKELSGLLTDLEGEHDTRLTALEARVTALEAAVVPIFFTVSRSTVGTYAIDELIPFDVVKSDSGNVFDTTTGRFTAPVDGNYFFVVSLLATTSTVGDIRLWKNGVSTGIAGFGINPPATSFAKSVLAGILPLQTGDYIEVRVAGSTSTIYGHATEHHSLFSGFKLAG